MYMGVAGCKRWFRLCGGLDSVHRRTFAFASRGAVRAAEMQMHGCIFTEGFYWRRDAIAGLMAFPFAVSLQQGLLAGSGRSWFDALHGEGLLGSHRSPVP